MSANVLSGNIQPKCLATSTPKTRIPVASPSPRPLRRSYSVRLRGDRNAPEIRSSPLYPQDVNHPFGKPEVFHHPVAGSAVQNHSSANAPPLRRGKSFMERGERGGAARISNCGSAGPYRAANAATTTAAQNRRNAACGHKGAESPCSPNDARTRSLSLSLSNNNSSRLSVPQSPSVASSPRTPPTSPSEYRHHSQSRSGGSGSGGLGGATDWDNESITSGISGISLASSTCDHASVARNGTTFSGRSMKYVFHCSQHAGATGEDYLTPTQRAHRQVRRLKSLLQQAQKDLEQKDSDIVKLTKEVVELRLYKAALSSPEERSNSSDAVTVRENQMDEISELPDGIVPNHIGNEMTSSYTDSGHYDDYTNSSVHSKDSVLLGEDYVQSPFKKNRPPDSADKSVATESGECSFECEHQQIMADYERRIHELVKSHENESHEVRQRHNDKVEELLQRIAEINKRYWEMVPDLDNAKERIKELEVDLEKALRKLEESEDHHKQMYLQMYAQGQEAARLERENQVMELAQQVPSRISVPELLQQLQVTQNELENIKDIEYASSSNSLKPLLSAKEAVTLWVLGARKAMYKQLMEAKNKKIDPEITLQFLKSAIYYFLTDKENNQGHLRAIQSILGFTPSEISNIEKARTT